MVGWELILTGASAVGTLLLAGAATWQIVATERSRKRDRAVRKLETVYGPLRQEAETWATPWNLLDDPSFERLNGVRTQPSLFYLLPPDLRRSLDRIHDIGQRLMSLRDEVADRTQIAMNEWAEEHVDPEDDDWDGLHDTTIKVWLEPRRALDGPRYIDPLLLWVADTPLRSRIEQLADENLAEEWRIEVAGRGREFGGLRQAEDLVAHVHDTLEDLDRARRLREDVNELVELGEAVRDRLSDEIEQLRRLLD